MKHTVGGIIQRLRDVISTRDAIGQSDSDLVRALSAAMRDSTAFETIVRRHGPMVLVAAFASSDCSTARQRGRG